TRARNHGLGRERADEQTDRSPNRAERNHRQSASQPYHAQNGSEVGGRSGQDGRGSRGEGGGTQALRQDGVAYIGVRVVHLFSFAARPTKASQRRAAPPGSPLVRSTTEDFLRGMTR